MDPRQLSRIALLVTCVLIAIPQQTCADEDWQQWTTVKHQQPLGDRWKLSLSGRGRIDDNISRRRDLMIRPAVEYRIGPRFDLGLGFDHLHTYPPGKDAEDRFWQQANLKLKQGNNAVEQRVRLEQRWIDTVGGIVHRGRYRFRIEHILKDTAWYIAASNELFYNLNSQGEGPPTGFEQDRIFVGAGYYVTDNFWIEGGYQWKNKSRRDEANQTVHALMLTLTFRGKPLGK
jgi:hypothetical protein